MSKTEAQKDGRGGDRRSIDYHLTLSMAKELGMVENNATGRAIRKYFIQCEEELIALLKYKNEEMQYEIERDFSSMRWLRDKALDKVEVDAVVVLREMWKEERDARLDFVSAEYKEADIKHLGKARDLIKFLRPHLERTIERLTKVSNHLNLYHGLSWDSTILMRLEGVIEDFKFVEMWTRK